MDFTGFILWIVIGGVAGWLAGQFMRGGGLGLIGNIIVGIVGGVIGGWIFGLFGIAAGGIFGSLITSLIGAVVLLFVVGLFKR
jgi:uncharacterized membrane protein YeaQ/YmgE (transglycosylase-associated protein family)